MDKSIQNQTHTPRFENGCTTSKKGCAQPPKKGVHNLQKRVCTSLPKSTTRNTNSIKRSEFQSAHGLEFTLRTRPNLPCAHDRIYHAHTVIKAIRTAPNLVVICIIQATLLVIENHPPRGGKFLWAFQIVIYLNRNFFSQCARDGKKPARPSKKLAHDLSFCCVSHVVPPNTGKRKCTKI